MKKLKKFWQENSVLLVLLLILIACIVAISIVVFTYFVGDSNTKYGERLENIENYKVDIKSLSAKIEEDEAIEDVNIKISGKTIYTEITFASKTTLVEAESKALTSLEYFDEDTLEYYDLEFLITAAETDDSDGFKIMGSHNNGGTGGIVWNNNTPVKNEE